MFNVAYGIFKKNWEAKETEFVKYFDNQWIGRGFWNRGACAFAPSDNNGLEGFHKHFKDFLDRKRRPLLKLPEAITHFLDKQSERYKQETLSFNTQPDRTNADWEKTYYISKTAPEFKDGENTYFIHEKHKKTVTPIHVNNYNKASWTTLNGLSVIFELNKVQMSDSNVMMSTCTSKSFLKNFFLRSCYAIRRRPQCTTA
jgi:hypothetical protein